MPSSFSMPSSTQACLVTLAGLLVGLFVGFGMEGWSGNTVAPTVERKTETVTTPAATAATTTTSTSMWQPRTNGVACPGKSKTLDPALFKSQFGEDKELLGWFGHLCGGTYIEMGALDGIRYSNSHVFNKGLDWKGLLIEASPKQYERLVQNRPNELAVVHAGVCADTSELNWIEGKWAMTGGFLEFASEEHKKNFFTAKTIANPRKVKCEPMSAILKENFGDNIFFDFFSLDIEGAELQALQSIDFSKVSFGIIMVEASGFNKMKDQAVRSLLQRNGYTYMTRDAGKDEFGNDWFVNQDWNEIYKDVIYS